MTPDTSHVQTGSIRTDFVSFPSRSGLNICACLDHRGDLSGLPWVVMAPKYGETKKNNLQLAYQLVANGVNVLRFDQTNHVGESEGRMQDFSLPGAVADILGCYDYLENAGHARTAVLVSNSLSARCAFRAAVEDRRIARLVSVVGVVNMQRTLRAVYNEDIFGTFLAGRHWGLTDILGFDINGEIFLGTAVDARMHDLEGTIEDLSRLRVPLIYFHATNDAWVDAEDVARAIERQSLARSIPIEGAMHEVRENPRAAETVFRRVVWACLSVEDYPGDDRAGLRDADMRLVLAQNKRERERLRRSEMPSESETSFWSGYLEKYSVLEKSEDYREYIRLLGRLCAFRPGAAVLDAGCGNGMFGRWALRETMLQRQAAPSAPPEPSIYIGLDLTDRGLRDAMGHHVDALARFPEELGRAGPPGFGYLRFDFNDLANPSSGDARLPFEDASFDVVCCSLVLSYLRRPLALLQELHRVARPGAVLVLSSMKPHCDMSAIYRDFMEQQAEPEEIERARNLLRAAGKIRQKEEVGHYAFFSDLELAALATEAGFTVREAMQSLGNQAVVVKAQK